LRVASGAAFAPAAISNFFSIHYGGDLRPADLRDSGATGGGYMLSRGVLSRASISTPGEGPAVRVVVNGDADYDARTTRMAVRLLLESLGGPEYSIDLDQTVEVPISHGFGASAASALSAVMAVAAALSVEREPAEVAYFAHAADILCRTGLGTVSVVYKYGGAGIIVKPGMPGVAVVRAVSVPDGIRVVTASLGSYTKEGLISSPAMVSRVNRLGAESLEIASDLTIESLVRAGEYFTAGLGIASPLVQRLAETAKSAGAIGASQNMVGDAIHSLVWSDDAERVASTLAASEPSAEIGVYDLATGPAAVVAPDRVLS
jgi:pantoate kinase